MVDINVSFTRLSAPYNYIWDRDIYSFHCIWCIMHMSCLANELHSLLELLYFTNNFVLYNFDVQITFN